ncbi:hypothetical protein D7Y13_01440 [Corallococcus praedator]|uniref:Uncharacterized protein n=1 Tax=Corallococcus praedator TaxID=2316724 RepID=A0ABX9QQX3_9BACT|nr:hypothetical protein D7X75_06295 [Corallococcus sp. CA031C]RKI17121.1 hypothetical protein D7Y13_01440 [Corallococcus praedator]
MHGVVKLTGQSPEAVRGWDWEDVVHLLALCALEVDEARSARTHGPAAPSGPQTTTTVFKKRPKR